MTKRESTAGYSDEAKDLICRYERYSFEDVHKPVLHLLPDAPCRVLDIGSGTGRDAAAFARQGHIVTAVEPTAALREPGMKLHPDLGIEWIDDSLPALDGLKACSEAFDLIMLTAVWMHLDEKEREKAMAELARLAAPGAKMFFMLRHGPVPEGRRMFNVSGEETEALSAPYRFRRLFMTQHGSLSEANHRNGVTWTRLMLIKA